MESTSTLPDCDDSIYTSHYCEENIYWLVNRFSSSPGAEQDWDVFSVFVSNPTRTVALWNQRTGSSKDTAIVWDYHVVCVLRPRVHSRSSGYNLANVRGAWIYDLDTHLPLPCHWRGTQLVILDSFRKFIPPGSCLVYVEQTFPLGIGIPVQYQSLFRVIPADIYLDNFASDRSHMLDDSLSIASEGPRYLSEPPPYPVIRGPEAEKRGIAHNLMTHFVSMTESDQGFGTVMDLDAFMMWCSLSS